MPVKAFKVPDAQGEGESLILFEVSESSFDPGQIPRKAARSDIETAAKSLKEALAPVTATACLLLDSLKAASPGKVTLEFGVELSGAAGIPLITSGEAKANIKVTMVWEDRA
jgi:hypothetical protein